MPGGHHVLPFVEGVQSFLLLPGLAPAAQFCGLFLILRLVKTLQVQFLAEYKEAQKQRGQEEQALWVDGTLVTSADSGPVDDMSRIWP